VSARRIDELWKKGKKKERRLRIEQIDEQALTKNANQPCFGIRVQKLPIIAPQRFDSEINQVGRAEVLYELKTPRPKRPAARKSPGPLRPRGTTFRPRLPMTETRPAARPCPTLRLTTYVQPPGLEPPAGSQPGDEQYQGGMANQHGLRTPSPISGSRIRHDSNYHHRWTPPEGLGRSAVARSIRRAEKPKAELRSSSPRTSDTQSPASCSTQSSQSASGNARKCIRILASLGRDQFA